MILCSIQVNCRPDVFQFRNEGLNQPKSEPQDQLDVEFLGFQQFVAAPNRVHHTDDQSEELKYGVEKVRIHLSN